MKNFYTISRKKRISLSFKNSIRPESSKPNAITYKLKSTLGNTTILTTIPKPSTQKLLESRIYL